MRISVAFLSGRSLQYLACLLFVLCCAGCATRPPDYPKELVYGDLRDGIVVMWEAPVPGAMREATESSEELAQIFLKGFAGKRSRIGMALLDEAQSSLARKWLAEPRESGAFVLARPEAAPALGGRFLVRVKLLSSGTNEREEHGSVTRPEFSHYERYTKDGKEYSRPVQVYVTKDTWRYIRQRSALLEVRVSDLWGVIQDWQFTQPATLETSKSFERTASLFFTHRQPNSRGESLYPAAAPDLSEVMRVAATLAGARLPRASCSEVGLWECMQQ